MATLLKRLADLSIVSNVLHNTTPYPPTRNGFMRDHQNLRGDATAVTTHLNQCIDKYGYSEHPSQGKK